jgi:hypothetical protein
MSTPIFTNQDITNSSTQLFFNGNIYELVTDPVSWENAIILSAQKSFLGVAGHLVTITSAAENIALWNKFGGYGPRIALTDSAIEGQWVWAAGPEQNQVTSFTSWASGEPNNWINEDSVQLSTREQGTWNDVPLSDGHTYIVEYEGGVALPDTTPPYVSSFNPIVSQIGVEVGSNIVLTFSEAIQKGTGRITIHSGSATGTVVVEYDASTSGDITISGTTLNIHHPDLLNSTHYFLTIEQGSIKDLAGNSYAGTSSYNFTTVAATATPIFTNQDITNSSTQLFFNGNIYELVTDPVSWENAIILSAQKSFLGVAGHLVTITSAAENIALWNKFGGYSPRIALTDSAIGGQWVWAAGPEQNQVTSFTSWASGEPNNWINEDSVQLSTREQGKWNDVPLSDGHTYIVEYEGGVAITGTSGNDIFQAGSGNHFFNGGTGYDTVFFNGREGNYTIVHPGSEFLVIDNEGGDGTNMVSNIELLQFTDHTLCIDSNPSINLLQSYRIYKAAFDRTPDYGGLGYWFGVMEFGASLTHIAEGFMGSNEFKAMYGDNPTDSTFVNLLYHHVLDRDLDQAGYDFWINDLKVESRAQVLAHFSESTENIANLAGVIANGIIYELLYWALPAVQ